MSRFFTLSYIVIVLLSLASCASDDAMSVNDEEQEGGSETVKITFTINMGGETTSRSRATTWGDKYKTKTANIYENTIEEGKLQVLLYSADGSEFLGELQNVTYVRRSDDESYIYDVVGSIEVAKVNLTNNKLECKIVVLANYDTKVSNPSSLSNLGEITYSYDNHKTADIAAGKAGIPMFGVKTYSGDSALKLFNGVQTDAKEIYMLRAMAKIIVSTTIDAMAIKSVTLKNHNTTGYIVPTGYADYNDTKSLYIESTESIKNTFHPNSSRASTTTELSFEKESDNSFFIYVPEYGGYTSEDDTPKITIKFDFSIVEDEMESFYFDNYTTEGVRKQDNPNIERNNAYTFTVKKDKGFIVATDNWIAVYDNTFKFE